MQPQYWSIDLLPGLILSEQKLLKAQGIENTLDLLKQTKTQKSKKDLASQLKLHQKHLNKWIALSDLACIPSVGRQYCGLLLHAGITSVLQLAQTPFHRLHPQIIRLQVATIGRKDLTSVSLVKQWVEEAKILSRNKF